MGIHSKYTREERKIVCEIYKLSSKLYVLEKVRKVHPGKEKIDNLKNKVDLLKKQLNGKYGNWNSRTFKHRVVWN